MRETPRVIAIGETLMDIAPMDGADHEYPGGSPANVALALGRLGRTPMLATQFAPDARGPVLQTWLEDAGVRVQATAPQTARTSTARVQWDEDRNAHYTFDVTWDVSQATLGALPEADAIHIGSIATVLAPGSDAVESFVRDRSASALVSFDPNARPQLTPDHAAATAQVERLIAMSDVLKVSDEDLAWYWPQTAPLDAARRLLGSATTDGPIVIALTRGGEGAVILRGDEALEVKAPRVTVSDTIAAGDTFTAAFVDALLTAGASGPAARDRLGELTIDQLGHAASWAATAAAITVSRPGADPPSRSELESASALD